MIAFDWKLDRIGADCAFKHSLMMDDRIAPTFFVEVEEVANLETGVSLQNIVNLPRPFYNSRRYIYALRKGAAE